MIDKNVTLVALNNDKAKASFRSWDVVGCIMPMTSPWMAIPSFLFYSDNFEMSFTFPLCNAGITEELETVQ